MRQKNNGKGEGNTLQNQFTRFLVSAVRRNKAKYLKKQERVTDCEIRTEPDRIEAKANSVQELLGFAALTEALGKLSEKERFVFFARVLDRRDYQEIAKDLGIGYKGACAMYYRTCRKLREMLWR